MYISGGTGYLGSALIPDLLARGMAVRALARPGSESKLPSGCEAVIANPLDPAAFRHTIAPCDTFVHLLGTPRPAPWKGAQFRAIDGVSLQASVQAATYAGIRHFIYVSVAHPAPVMRAYLEVRQRCERYILDAGLCATILRPWYVLGPGHYWPYAIAPLYGLLEKFPPTREGAFRLGLISRSQMIRSLAWAVENRPDRVSVLDVPAIRNR